MSRDPLVLDLLFLLHIGKGLISAVTLSVVVPLEEILGLKWAL